MNRCGSCGAPTNEGGTYNYDPNVDKPPYEPSPELLRADAHHEDVLKFRAIATFMKKKMGWSWDKALPLMSIILHDRDDFLLQKYGPDRGLDCSQPLSQEWQRQMEVTTWMMARYKDMSDIVDAVVRFMAEEEDAS